MLSMEIIMITISMTFIMMMHPLSMGLNLLTQTIMISLMTGKMNMTFWFSYILFLVMIGGMLILFVYMTSIASNEKFKFSPIIMFLTSLMIMISLIINQKSIITIKTHEANLFTIINNYMNINLKYFTPNISILMMSAMVYLLLVLVMIVKITKKTNGPLRQK